VTGETLLEVIHAVHVNGATFTFHCFDSVLITMLLLKLLR
jgi:hypothetical protein